MFRNSGGKQQTQGGKTYRNTEIWQRLPLLPLPLALPFRKEQELTEFYDLRRGITEDFQRLTS